MNINILTLLKSVAAMAAMVTTVPRPLLCEFYMHLSTDPL